jgi:hypothetical protein
LRTQIFAIKSAPSYPCHQIRVMATVLIINDGGAPKPRLNSNTNDLTGF